MPLQHTSGAEAVVTYWPSPLPEAAVTFTTPPPRCPCAKTGGSRHATVTILQRGRGKAPLPLRCPATEAELAAARSGTVAAAVPFTRHRLRAVKPPPARHWRSYGNDPLPTPAEALDEPFAAFPSWFLRIECDRCGKVQMINEAHAPWRARRIADILHIMRHDGCGGLAAKAELQTGIDGVSSRPVRRIVLRAG